MIKAKIIYLDQNMWIELARAEKLGIPAETINILNLIKSKVANGEWVFPWSYVHLQETAKISDDDRRSRLSKLMHDISNGYHIFPFTEVVNKEIEIGLKAIKDGRKIISNKVIAVTDKWIEIVGLPPEITNLFNVNSFEVFSELSHLTQGHLLDDGAFYRQVFEKHRSWLTSNIPKPHEEVIFMGKFLIDQIKFYHGTTFGIGKEDFDSYFSNGKDDIFNWYKEMPALYCQSKLVYQMMRDKNYQIADHDLNDIAALCVAIPYCDVVIAERQWGKIASNQLKLDKLYGCKISTSLKELETI